MIKSLSYYLFFIVFLTYTNGCPTSCSCSGTVVVCQSGSLQNTVAKVPKSTQQLTLQGSKMRGDLKQSFSHTESFSQLSNLTVTKYYISQLSETTFQGMVNLQYLSLTHNDISNIDNKAFEGLLSLIHLDLSHNRIANIDEIFYTLQKLEFLDLSWNRFYSLPSGIFKSQGRLKTLILDGNNMQNIYSYSFQWLRSLLHLSLSNCQLFSIATDLFTITRNLISLDLSSNGLTKPLMLNILRSLPNLRTLSLYNNTIYKLEKNQFSGINLDTLNLSRNNLRQIFDATFKYFNTKHLDLSLNSIDHLDSGSLHPMAPQLEYLSLAGNPLQKLPVNAFTELYRLRELNLSDCSINSLNKFEGPKSLQKLDLSANNLKNIPESTLRIFSNLKWIKVERNSWVCDCHIRGFRNWLQNPTYSRTLQCSKLSQSDGCDFLQCKIPLGLHERRIKQLKDEEISKCDVELKNKPDSNTVLIIAISCSIFAIVVFMALIILWKCVCKKNGPHWLCNQSAEDSSHLEKAEKRRAFQDLDIGSLNESDRSFNVRNYFNSMVQNPSSLSQGTPPYSQKDNSNLGSQTSLYSVVSYAYGRESAV
ncbi:leucine-rich repeat transmembrane neuronal protein 4 isoform X2 [Octopus bimaculoides]|uniref:LRRNT domain-containing protein n=2 Tax=Octopus bimaculoides TaxID=37653 RepID=A0A0L8FU86_OCTBM|nr:leucine-rich repeat transmembrane neuronal protein 4 isoform X2 [Octopus bimaculoides]|eukprot:XP_014786811.1 PREDICTED: leucine-rich repeat transmembrane neuronal protein 4-like [Octopus bimaculoides]